MKRHILTMVISLAAIVIAPLRAEIPPDGWEESVDMATDGVCPKIATNTNYIHTVYVNPNTGYLYYKRSTDYGFSWLDEVVLYDQPVGTASIAVDDIGKVYAVWAKPIDGYWELWWRHSSNNGVSWSEPVEIPLNLSDMLGDPMPSLTIDSERKLHMAFGYSYEVGGEWNVEMRWTYYDPASGEWLRPEVVLNCGQIVARNFSSITTLGTDPHITFTRELATNPPYYWFDVARKESGVWITQTLYEHHGSFCSIDETNCPNSYLHICWVFKAFQDGQWQLPYIWYCRSTDGGINWTVRRFEDIICYPDASLSADDKGLHLIYTSGTANPPKTELYWRRSTDYGATWPWPTPDTLESRDRNWYQIYSSDVSSSTGAMGRHVVFYMLDLNIERNDIWYLANYDSLLSDDLNATAFNWGRHLYRIPEVNHFHLVYQSKGKVRYTHSEDNFQTWAPFHRLDNGSYPTVGYIMTPNYEWHAPVIAYIHQENQIGYQWYDDITQQWYGFYITPPYPYDVVGPPSITTAGYDVCLTFSAHSLMFPGSAILYYQFPFNSPGPGDPFPVAISQGNDLSAPCVAYDYYSPTGGIHVVYDTSSNIFYRWKDSEGQWWPREDVSCRWYPPCDFPADTAFVEPWGDQVFCDWMRRFQYPSTEIYRNWKPIGIPEWSIWTIQNRSQSPYESSDYPVGVIGDFSVWTEPPQMVANSDIRYLSDTWGYGWVCTTPERSIFCHSQLFIDPAGPIPQCHLYNAWTEGSAVPYRVSTKELIFVGGKGNPTLPAYYDVVAGDSAPSRYCTKRDSFIRYTRFNVDLGRSELIYTLPFLNPLYPGYKLLCITYFEGTSTRKEQILIDGTDYGTFEFKPNRPETVSITIPRLHYEKDHKVVVVFKGSPTAKVGLVLYQLEKVGGGKGGIQTLATLNTEQPTALCISPNPAKNLIHISYALKNKSDVSIQLFDISGRLVRKLLVGQKEPGRYALSIDTKGLPCGIYFVKCKLGQDLRTEKVILMK